MTRKAFAKDRCRDEAIRKHVTAVEKSFAGIT
jgi:hypothetical protein